MVAKESGKPSSGLCGLARTVRPECSELRDDEVWTRERERGYAAES
ncbi:hypothetical protein ABT336_01045 [Micromonospora sp. NPDC000207]